MSTVELNKIKRKKKGNTRNQNCQYRTKKNHRQNIAVSEWKVSIVQWYRIVNIPISFRTVSSENSARQQPESARKGHRINAVDWALDFLDAENESPDRSVEGAAHLFARKVSCVQSSILAYMQATWMHASVYLVDVTARPAAVFGCNLYSGNMQSPCPER